MNRNGLFLTSFSLILMCLTGCMSVHHTRAFNGIRADGGLEPAEAVEIENSGWFLLNCIPLASGDPVFPNSTACKFFSNTLTVENNLRALRTEMRIAHGTHVANVTSHRTEESVFLFLLSRKACHTSAVILKDATSPEKKIVP